MVPQQADRSIINRAKDTQLSDLVRQRADRFNCNVNAVPGFKNFGGLNPFPTPDGVPVAIMSPASSVIPFDSVSIKSAIGKIMSPVDPDWRSSPFTRVSTFRFCGSLTADLCTMTGPIGHVVSRLLPIKTVYVSSADRALLYHLQLYSRIYDQAHVLWRCAIRFLI